MKNVTITLDEETAAWVRVCAAEHDMSVSRLIGLVVRDRMREARAYEDAMRQYLSKRPSRLKRTDGRYAPREALHERDRLR